MRSALTTFGIATGVAAIIAVVGLLGGLRSAISSQFAGLGSNSLSVVPFTPLADALQGRRSKLRPADVELIASRVEGVRYITPLLVMHQDVRYGGRTTVTQVRGTTHTFQDVHNAYPRTGRFLSPSDDLTRRRVCVVGERTREMLGLPDDPVGEYLALAGDWCKVIGVMESKGELLGSSQDGHVVLPYQTLVTLSGPNHAPDLTIQLAVTDSSARSGIAERIRTLLRGARRLGPNDEDDFRVHAAEEIVNAFEQTANTITAFVAGMVGISLVVGGVGIMNMMLVSVTERTREIGICKALGATRREIVLQFLAESVALSIAGGMAGLAVGAAVAAFIASLIPDFPSALPPTWAVLVAIGFSALVGIVFGVLPALRAANLDPVEALRHE